MKAKIKKDVKIMTMPKSKFILPPLEIGSKDLGKHLANLRKKKGYTQVELAKKLGVIQVIISDYERNRVRLHPDMIIRLSQALSVSSDELLGIKNQIFEDEPKLKFMKRIKKIEELPISKQKALLQTIDTFLKGALVS